MEKKIAFRTLGCRLNQYETDALASEFHKKGWKVVSFRDSADVYLINTCTVTGQADTKSRNMVRQAVKKNQDAAVVVTGCMVDNHKEKLRSQLEGVDYFVPNGQKSRIFSVLDAHFRGEASQAEGFGRDVFGFVPAGHTFHTRSMIKVQDGCDNFCTYCIIPQVRGRAISRPASAVLENIRQVLAYGFKEIVLTGVNIGRYEYEGLKFEGLVEKILNMEGDFRVRISSIEPEGFTARFYELFAHPRLAPHLHLCIQSGSDKVLHAMHRMYTVAGFREIVDGIRSHIPDFNFTTDIIVGFPGETEDDFDASLRAIREIGFSHVHTFKFSRRGGTRAYRMNEQVPEKVKTERAARVRGVAEEVKMDFRQKFIGKTQRVLAERIDAQGMAQGYGGHFLPVRFTGKALQRNTFYDVRLTGVDTSDDNLPLIGRAGK